MSERIGLDLLVDSLRSELAGQSPQIAAAPQAALDDAAVIASENKILAVVHRRLATGPLLRPLLAANAATMAANAALLDELGKLTPALRATGLPFVFIKGPLQQKIFHGTFFQRASADLDLLVRPHDFARFKELLLARGYALTTPSVWWHHTLGEQHFRKTAAGHAALDLHHRVHQPGAPAPRGASAWLGDIYEIEVDGIKIPTLSATSGMLLCTISIAKALYNREPSAAYLCDLYAGFMAATPVAINSFFTLARDVGLAGHAAVAVRLMDEVLGLSLDHGQPYGEVLGSISSDDLVRMVLLPRDAATRWPTRRQMLWELCDREPFRYSRELARVAGSEITRRIFERATPA